MAACGQSDLKHFIVLPKVSFPSSVYSCLCHFRLKRLLNESIEFYNPQEHCCRCYMYFIQSKMPTNVFLNLKTLICLVLYIVTGSLSETDLEFRQVSLQRCSRHVGLVGVSGPACWSCCSCHQDPDKRLEDRQKDTFFLISVSFHLSVAEGRMCLGWTRCICGMSNTATDAELFRVQPLLFWHVLWLFWVLVCICWDTDEHELNSWRISIFGDWSFPQTCSHFSRFWIGGNLALWKLTLSSLCSQHRLGNMSMIWFLILYFISYIQNLYKFLLNIHSNTQYHQ